MADVCGHDSGPTGQEVGGDRKQSPAYPYPYLVDSPEDGGVEDHGHLPLHAAVDAESAAREFARAYEDAEEPPIFTCDGVQDLLRPVVYEYDTAGSRPPTTEELADSEFSFDCIRFEKAQPGDPFAQLWWRIEAVQRCGAYDEEGDFYCRLADGHEGTHALTTEPVPQATPPDSVASSDAGGGV